MDNNKTFKQTDTVEIEFTFKEIGLLRGALFTEADYLEKESLRDFESAEAFPDDDYYKNQFAKSSKKFYEARILRDSFQDRFKDKTGFCAYDMENISESKI